MNRLAVLLLLAASSSTASAFMASPPTSNRAMMVGRTNTLSSSTSKTAESVEVTNDNNDDDATAGMLPEYAAAYKKAIQVVEGVVGDSDPMMKAGLHHFCMEYVSATQKSFEKTKSETATPEMALQRIMEGLQYGFKFGMGPDKYTFGVTHEALRGDPETEDGNTMDFYGWGCDFFRDFIDLDDSLVAGEENLQKALEQAKAGENVVFLANHQSEADPQVVSLLLEKAGYGEAGADVVYVAGHKVTTDALAIPFSMGRNLICIHSKKHINADPDTKPIKSRQNLAAMSGMLDKLKKGGTILWVAPSGGRDRRDVEKGVTPIAPFDSKTLDMFRLMGNKSKKPTHFYSMAMVSYELCPPPDSIEAGTGEQRNFRFTPVAIKVGPELVSEGGLEQRQAWNKHAMDQTLEDYIEIRSKLFPGTEPEMEEGTAEGDNEE